MIFECFSASRVARHMRRPTKQHGSFFPGPLEHVHFCLTLGEVWAWLMCGKGSQKEDTHFLHPFKTNGAFLQGNVIWFFWFFLDLKWLYVCHKKGFSLCIQNKFSFHFPWSGLVWNSYFFQLAESICLGKAFSFCSYMYKKNPKCPGFQAYGF